MNRRRYIIMLGIVSLMGLFSACDMLEDVYDDPIVEKQEGQYYIDATDYTMHDNVMLLRLADGTYGSY